jgi:uncharacterized membrane protein YdjX (TVP38/TMEM64 family)
MNKTKKPSIYSLIPLALVILSMAALLIFSFSEHWNIKDYIQLHQQIQLFHNQHPVSTPLIFMGIYILCTLLSIPGIFLLSLLAGYLFVQPYSTLYVLIASTAGSCLLFVMTRSALSYLLYKIPEKHLKRMESGFQKHAANYLLCLRLIPLFPFWVVNVAGAFFNVSFYTFFWTTVVGMIPSVYFFTQSGEGLEVLLQSQDPFNLVTFFNSQLGWGLAGLALLSVIPLFFKQSKQLQSEQIKHE